MIKVSINISKLLNCVQHTGFTHNNGRMCPHYFRKTFANHFHHFYAVAREDIHWNCDEFCEYHNETLVAHKRNYRMELRRLVSFRVDVDLVIDVVLNGSEKQKIFIKQVKMNVREFNFYNSTV